MNRNKIPLQKSSDFFYINIKASLIISISKLVFLAIDLILNNMDIYLKS